MVEYSLARMLIEMDIVPDYILGSSLGEFPGSQCFDISNPDVIPFLNDYVSKLSETFSTAIH